MLSFLLGSGFSYDEKIPGLKEINERFINTKADDIFLGSDQRAFYLVGGQKDPNGWFPNNIRDRTFFEKFIQFYVKDVVKGKENFDYERFVDYFYLQKKDSGYPEELNSFLEKFRHEAYGEHSLGDDNTNLLFRFYNIFSQLLENQISNPRYYEDADYSGYPRYGNFIRFIGDLLDNKNELKVHTLNHDLFFDFLGSKQSRLWPHFCDGYTEMNSPYFGELYTQIQGVTKSFKVRLPYYNGIYKKKLCFYKLHGSIDTYSFNISSSDNDMTRVKRKFGIGDIYKEIKNKNGDYEYLSGFQHKYPDFLSGTTYKMLFYSDNYYKELHNHFRNNLNESELFFVIGYGFKDQGINEMIETNFLKKGEKMFVVDPYPNKEAFETSYNIEFVEKGVNDIDNKEWQALTK